ncbi:MAG: ribonuclease J [Anaerolineae bacterium]|nr:ribonuclease J [Anaerolineae bacterium]
MAQQARDNELIITPIGGLGEIGKNMMAIEYGGDIIIIDCGVMFPESDMLGIDLVLPDYTFILPRADRIRGVILTHGHEDHIGGLPYFLRSVNVPVYGSDLTLGLVKVRLQEHRMLSVAELHEVRMGDKVRLGAFEVEFFSVNHSIPEGLGLAIRCPLGLVVHSGDFKFDYTPVQGRGTDFVKLASLGGEGVFVLLSDSTNADTPGFTPSERVVAEALGDVFHEAGGRIIVVTFASLISRIQQVVDAAVRHGRRVAITGFSMEKNTVMAQELGYLRIPEGTLIGIEDIGQLPDDQVTILATGSQGEPSAALARMAAGRHPHVSLKPGDTVVLSAHPIPGNEEMVHRIINRLFQRGANVITDQMLPVHVSGHAGQEEEKLLLAMTRPRYFVPIHGELRHLHLHARTAIEMGVPRENVFVAENGYELHFTEERGWIGERMPGGYVFVDGAGVGDIGPAVMRNRAALAEAGVVAVSVLMDQSSGRVVGEPEIVSRGFVYLPEFGGIIDSARQVLLQDLKESRPTGRGAIANRIRSVLARHFHEQTGRNPVILPLVLVSPA